MANEKGRVVDVEVNPPVNTAESAAPGVPLPVSTPTTGVPAMEQHSGAGTIPAAAPMPAEAEERPFGAPPPDRSR